MKTKVLVVHKHERGEGSKILGVFRANARGETLANIMRSTATPPVDLIDVEAIEITEPVQLSKGKLAALRSLANKGTPGVDGWRLVPALVIDMLVEEIRSQQFGGGTLLAVTPFGLATLAENPEP
jgi:hypothetical protein